MNVIGKGLDFFLAQSGIAGLNLTIDVAFSHMVHINQHNATYPASRQRLGSPRTDPAHSDHHCMHLRIQKGVRAIAIEPVKSAKTAA
jgi:hypothetical protein